MKKTKSSLIAAVVMLPLIAIISILSINRAKEYESVDLVIAGTAKLRNTIEIPLEKADHLAVSYTSKNIKVYPGDSDKIVIKEYLLSDKESAHATCEVENGIATITGKRTSTIILFGGIGEKIEVYLPKEGLKTVSIETKSGNITAEDGFSLQAESVSVAATSGNIHWFHTQSKEIDIATISGNIHCNEAYAEKINLAATSGNIDAGNIEGTMSMATSSGRIEALQVKGCGTFTANSGSIKVEVLDLTGDIDVQTSSGSVKLYVPKESSFSLEAQTGSGKIKTDFDKMLSYNKKGNQAYGTIGESAEYKISAKASSGSVKIERR